MKRITPLPRKFRFQLHPTLTYVSFWHPPFLSVSRRQTCTYHLILLYTQSSSRTLAPPVLPQLLARDWLSFFSSTVVTRPGARGLQSIDLHPSRNLTGSGFRPLSKIPYCCSDEPGPCFSSGVAIPLSGWLRIFDLVSCYPTNISNPQ